MSTFGEDLIQSLTEAVAHAKGQGGGKPPFGGPEQVLAYLSRYTHRVAISNSRLISADANTVKRRSQFRVKHGALNLLY